MIISTRSQHQFLFLLLPAPRYLINNITKYENEVTEVKAHHNTRVQQREGVLTVSKLDPIKHHKITPLHSSYYLQRFNSDSSIYGSQSNLNVRVCYTCYYRVRDDKGIPGIITEKQYRRFETFCDQKLGPSYLTIRGQSSRRCDSNRLRHRDHWFYDDDSHHENYQCYDDGSHHKNCPSLIRPSLSRSHDDGSHHENYRCYDDGSHHKNCPRSI